jgi:hypothetical protein
VTARRLRSVAVVVIAFVLGALLNPFAGDANARETSARPTAITATPRRQSSAATTPSGASERTERAAVDAAAAFICNGQALLDMTAEEVDSYLRERVTRESADRLIEEHLHDLASLREALSRGTGRTVYRQGVLAWHVESFDDHEARVEIWHVGVLTRAGVAPPQAGWMISTVDLRWDRGGWKVADEIAVPGPAPILNDSVPPATAEDLLDELDGFTDFGAPS